MDRALERYVEAIEGYLGQRRGRELTLSPADFEIARGWYRGGISVAAVRAGIERVLAEGHEPMSLAFCRQSVESSGNSRDRSGAQPVVAPNRSERAAAIAAQRVEALRAAIDALPEGTRGRFEALRKQLDGAITDRDQLDAAVSCAALDAVAPDVVARLRGETERAVARQRGKVSPGALGQAVLHQQRRRARDLLGLPYLGE
jgi:hypothetical protein